MISNNITLIGNLGSDINVNEFASDKRVGKVGLAYSSSFTNKKGEREEKTDWFNLTIWNKTCERMAAQVGKGSRVLIEGRLTTNSYENCSRFKNSACTSTENRNVCWFIHAALLQ